MKKILLSLVSLFTFISCSNPSEENIIENSKNKNEELSSARVSATSAEFRACYVIPVGNVASFKSRITTDVNLKNFLTQNNVSLDATITSDGNVPNIPFVLFTNNIQVNVSYVDLVLHIPFSTLSGTTPAQIQASLNQKVLGLVNATRSNTSIFSSGNEKPAFFGLKVPTATGGVAEVKINKTLYVYPLQAKVEGVPVSVVFSPTEFLKHTTRIEGVMNSVNGRNPLENVKSQLYFVRSNGSTGSVVSVNNLIEFDLTGIKAFFRSNRNFNIIAGTGTDQEQNFGSEAQLYYPLKKSNGQPLTGAALVQSQKDNIPVIRGNNAVIPTGTSASNIFQRSQFETLIVQ